MTIDSSSHVREWGFRNPGNFARGIRNTAQGIRNPTKDWNRKSTFHWQNWHPVLGLRNPRRGIQIPRLSSIPLHFTWGETAAQWQGTCIWVGMDGGGGGEGVVWRCVRDLVALVLYCTVGLWWEILPLRRLAILSFWKKLGHNSSRSLRKKKWYVPEFSVYLTSWRVKNKNS